MADKILVFGNFLVKQDAVPIKLIPRLQEMFEDIEFIELDPTEDLQNYGRDLKIIDCVTDIDEVKKIKLETEGDFEKLELGKVYSMHDFDLGYNLKLLRKMEMIDRVEIICVPMNIEEEEAFNQIQLILRK